MPTTRAIRRPVKWEKLPLAPVPMKISYALAVAVDKEKRSISIRRSVRMQKGM
jgi:hypothetical protein